MNAEDRKRISKFLSLALRHQPEAAGVKLDAAGWCSVAELLRGTKRLGKSISQQQLETVVAANDKQRFEFSPDGREIRARQGHSVGVDLGYAETLPPELLHHGTPAQFVESIRVEGLKKQKRHHVHLHQDAAVATTVGKRRGKPVLLTIEAGKMHESGYEFFVTPNNVWLTNHVPPKFIRFPN